MPALTVARLALWEAGFPTQEGEAQPSLLLSFSPPAHILPRCHSIMMPRSGGGDRHLWLTALPDNQILTHPSPATLLTYEKDHERWAKPITRGLFISSGWGNGEQERQRAASPAKCCLGSAACLSWMQMHVVLTVGSD